MVEVMLGILGKVAEECLNVVFVCVLIPVDLSLAEGGVQKPTLEAKAARIGL